MPPQPRTHAVQFIGTERPLQSGVQAQHSLRRHIFLRRIQQSDLFTQFRAEIYGNKRGNMPVDGIGSGIHFFGSLFQSGGQIADIVNVVFFNQRTLARNAFRRFVQNAFDSHSQIRFFQSNLHGFNLLSRHAVVFQAVPAFQKACRDNTD